MATRRHRSSTTIAASAANVKLTEELKPPIEALHGASESYGSRASIALLQEKTGNLYRIRQSLINSTAESKGRDIFRQLKGFQVLLQTLRSVSGYYDPENITTEQKTAYFELLRVTMSVLSQALAEHNGNRRYFTKRVEDGGWTVLEQTIASTGIGGAVAGKRAADDDGQEQLFGCLFAFALGEESFVTMFSVIRRHLGSTKASDPETSEYPLRSNFDSIDEASILILRNKIQNLLGRNELLVNPEVIPSIYNFWLSLPKGKQDLDYQTRITSLSVLLILEVLALSSQYNLVAIHSTGLLSTALPHLFSSPFMAFEAAILSRILKALIEIGIFQLKDARFLYSAAMRSSEAADFLLRAIKSARVIPLVEFDLSRHGYSSIELKTLGRSFPPQSPSAGYTFTAWICVDHFDDSAHTTIFGTFDSTQTCFVLAYLEKGTNNFILQTSVKSPRPSVRFKSITFNQGRWYHIALVHRRPRTISSSKASLYVNGEFVEQVKCQYPAAPPPVTSKPEDTSLPGSSGNTSSAIQVFLGTPQDLATRLGKGVISTRWSFSSAHLFDEALNDDLIAVYHRLGPRYNGNFQDCLGSFQTYEASAALNMRNEMMHPGKEEKSDIVLAIRSNASNLMAETHVLLNISPTSVFNNDDRNSIDESEPIKSLSKLAAQNFYRLTRSGGNAIAINGAIPSVNEALSYPHGVAVLTGDPTVLVPQALDEASWRIGGCASVGLKMIEAANTRESVVRAVEILFECVKGNWRNSESMERDNGFGVLGGLLKGKMGAGTVVAPTEPGRSAAIEGGHQECERLSFELLSLVLGFVGYRHEKPENSIIVNPLAYRILLIDFDIWRKGALITQKLYFKQFIVFGSLSKHHVFNSKRLFRMRIVKRLVEALKGEQISAEVLEDFMEAFKSLVSCNLTAEVLRSLSLFITFSLHKPKQSISYSLRPQTSSMQLRQYVDSTPSSKRITALSDKLSCPPEDSKGTVNHAQLGVRVLQMYAEILCEDKTGVHMRKFAKQVTNKWLLYLLAEDDETVVVLGAKILARLLVIHGPTYVSKFAAKSGGFAIMQHRLRRWWNTPAIWPICFAILFNLDVIHLDFDRSFDLYNLLDAFLSNEELKVVYPEVLPVITALFRTGLKVIVKDQSNPDTPSGEQSERDKQRLSSRPVRPSHSRRRSMSVGADLHSKDPTQPLEHKLQEYASLLGTVSHFLTDIHARSATFREFAVSSSLVQEFLFVLFPVVVSSDGVSAEAELHSRDSTLSSNGSDVVINPLSQADTESTSIVRATSVESPQGSSTRRARPLRRGSSFVLITSKTGQTGPSSTRLIPTLSPRAKSMAPLNVSNLVVEGLLDLILVIFVDQVLERKDFPGFGLFLKVPPGFQEHQAYFNSYILRNTLSRLGSVIQLNKQLLWEPRVLSNLARFTTHLCEALLEGWFINGSEPLLDFTGVILEYLQSPDISAIKSVRLCSQAIATIRSVFLKVILMRLSELEEKGTTITDTVNFLNKMMFWQTIFLSSENTEGNFMRLICYLLYIKLVDAREDVRFASADLWRMLLVQRPDETSSILNQAITIDQKSISSGFKKLAEVDNDTFVYWIDEHRDPLDKFFLGAMSRPWEKFVIDENRKIDDAAQSRLSKRKDKLKQWATEDMANEDIFRTHEVATGHWMANIYASEHLKHQRAMQDQQDNLNFIASTFTKLDRELRRPGALLEDGKAEEWQLDQTEGRNRKRMRLLPDRTIHQQDYKPKRKTSEPLRSTNLKLNTRVDSLTSLDSNTATPISTKGSAFSESSVTNTASFERTELTQEPEEHEEGFEIVDGPTNSEDGYEDKNRKVIRTLQRGDQIERVYNISRIIGLEACEGLLILGKDSLYLLDNFFQRSDGEIVNVWQAAKDERDPYLQMISGREPSNKKPRLKTDEHETRNWRWADVLSVSKRRFLFRDVAIEAFFIDGRSYLLTAGSAKSRDELFLKLLAKAPQAGGNVAPSNPEDEWRLDALKSPEDVPQTFGSKFASVFNPTSSNPATRKWAKGEISNFHYLMLVNTMAGRTFNDLTQYPVFPWVLADYTSDELDLTNPRSFRDLSKPMGCQTLERQAEFRDRYKSFAEMGDETAPPFHYGTHYSSAMIVTSYLIRLQPFVQSYLLLQGGTFDYADRLFYSIRKAWISASCENMTDVRELIPEFFYLPEFLINSNGYNFGLRQGTGGRIDSVELPPWAKGDPKIFITKHREALESPFVSKQLHQWIDLIFGFKQRGEAALEATNVFHHLSYRGAKDLDAIDDPVERLATIGIIHNFGQTPHQVFTRPHVAREVIGHKFKRLDTAAESLTRLSFPILESQERVSSLLYSRKQDRLLCSAAFRINIPPNYDKYMEWGFIDGSARFYIADTRKLVGLFEHLHVGQLSCAIFVDSRTLITAGADCTISVWSVISGPKSVDLKPRGTLFGHTSPVNVLALSRSFSTFLSASVDGDVLLWDMNRLEFVRKLATGDSVDCARINDVTGDVLICRGPSVTLFTLNGDHILHHTACNPTDDYVTSCAFYEGTGNEWLERELIFTGHKCGVVNVWSRKIRNGRFVLDLVKRLNHVHRASEEASNVQAAISYILPMPQTLYTGDENGNVYEWDCVQRHDDKS